MSLDPNDSPNALEQPSTQTGVKKLNKLPLIIAIVTITIIFFSLGYAMYQRGQMNIKDAQEEETTKQNSNPDGMIKNLLQELLEQQNRSQETNMSFILPDKPIEEKDLGVPTDTEIEEKIDTGAEELAKLKAKLLLEAITSPTQVKNSLGNVSPTSTNPLGSLANAAKDVGATPGMDILTQVKNITNGAVDSRILKNEAFLEKSKKSFKYIDSSKTEQVSPYELKTGSIIPGVLITAVNSELPGQVLGQVSENVYDTATGEYLLIPQGTKIIGEYNADVVYGQSRILIAWNRLVFPDGQTLNIGSMNGTDQAGAGGFADQVNNHYWKVFGSAFLLTMLNGDMTVRNGELVIMRESALTDRKETAIEKAASKVIEKQMDVAPTIEIRSGYRFNIFVTKDMILEPIPTT